IGFFFKLSLAPFHMWTPDVYEGSPTIFTAFFASVPKIAAIGLLVKIFDAYLIKWLPSMQGIFILVAVISMFVGAFGAIKQTKIKRIMAYSSISNMGFLILALTNPATMKLVTEIYVIIYGVTVIGAFAVFTAIEKFYAFESIDDLSGLSKTSPYAALIIAIMMFSLAGIPPLAGFFAKFVILESLVASNHIIIAVLAVISSVISAYYYLNIVKVMYFDEVKGMLQLRMSMDNMIVAAFAGIYNIVYILFHSSAISYFSALNVLSLSK
ncbi:MAG: NADH-quinone oxidoreductase subunit N, partial [Alphaproteobacteria bacterium]|nr:NADH-quinone oxidoreductase subunit N [Alphaproteobacteria bacterium]